MSDYATILVDGLSRSFGAIHALCDVTFQVTRGECVALLGPNGAGKTTALRILASLDSFFTGTIRVLGFDPRSAPIDIKRRTGYLPEESVFFECMTPSELLRFAGRLHTIAEKPAQQRTSRLLKLFDLENKANVEISELSKGMRRKTAIALALLHDPDVLILDEPFDGLDVQSVAVLKDLLGHLARNGKTILVSSHRADVLESMCSRVIVLNYGVLVADGSIAEVCGKMAVATLEDAFISLTSGSPRPTQSFDIV